MAHGRHIKVLGKGDPARLADPRAVERMLDGLVSDLGMRMLGHAHLYEVEQELSRLNVEPFEDEGGITGVAVLSTSHCSIHTWPLRSFFVMDVYSCRDFDPSAVELALVRAVGAHRMKVSDLSMSLLYDDRSDAVAGDAPARGSARDTAAE